MNFPPPCVSHEDHTKDKSDQGTDLVPKMMLERTWWNCSTDRGARVKLFGTEFGTNSNSCAAAALKISSQFLTTRLAHSVPVPWNIRVMFPVVFHCVFWWSRCSRQRQGCPDLQPPWQLQCPQDARSSKFSWNEIWSFLAEWISILNMEMENSAQDSLNFGIFLI